MDNNLITQRNCSICADDNRAEIDKAILNGKSSRKISTDLFGSESKRDTINRHRLKCLENSGLLAESIKIGIQNNLINSTADVLEKLRELQEFADDLKNAAIRELKDENGELSFKPRAYETDIVFDDYGDRKETKSGEIGEPKRKTANLDDLLKRLENGLDIGVVSTRTRSADVRDLALKTVDKCNDTLTQFAKIFGAYTTDKPNPEAIDITLLKLINTLFDWIAETFPQSSAEHEQFHDEVIDKFGAWNADNLKRLFTDLAELPQNYRDAIRK